MRSRTAELLGAAQVARCRRRGRLRQRGMSAPDAQAQRRHPGLQRGAGSAHACSRACTRRWTRSAITYECVFVNDGSKDRSAALLRQQFQARPANTRVVLFHANFGQHSAVMAGLSYARGDYVVTLDADLQNPPEEIGKLVEKLDKGYDYVGTIRQQRQDTLWRRLLSRTMNAIRERITPVRITDQGCMMRGYARSVVTALNETREINTFIPALASLYAMNPIEVPILHEERHAGQSKYSLYSLIRLNFDLITGFSVVPLQLFSMIGMAVSTMAALLMAYLLVRRIIGGAGGRRVVHPVRRHVLLHRRWRCSGSACWASTSAASTARCASGRATSSRPFCEEREQPAVTRSARPGR